MPQHKGFTLIEVLAALIIISLGMLSVIRAVNQTISNTDYLRQKTLAHWVAMNKLTEVRLGPTAPSNDDTDGDVDMAGTTWHWRMKVTAVVDPMTNQATSMQQIVIKVAPKDAGADASIDSINGVYSSATTLGTPAQWDPGTPVSNSSSSSSSTSSKSSSSSIS